MAIVREQLILADKALLEDTSLKRVERTLRNYKELKNIPNTLFPFGAVVGKMPAAGKFHEAGRSSGSIDYVTSKLIVEAWIYLRAANAEILDQTISTLGNELYAKLFTDQTRGKLCQYTAVTFQEDYAYWNPYAIVKMLIEHHYVHTTGGI